MSLEDYMTLSEAAVEVGVQHITLRQAIRRGNLKAIKRGPIWFVSKAALYEWRDKQPHTPGPRKKST